MKKIYLLDAVSYLFRSYFAIRGMKNKQGVPTNALYGFIRSVEKIFKDFKPDHFAAVFDGPENKKSRTDIYAEYKANREQMPEDLYVQLELAHKYCEYRGIPMLAVQQVEADDTIGSIAKWAEAAGAVVYILSPDKDLCQLVNDNIYIINTNKENLLIDRDKVEELFGVFPEQIIDYLAIVGDTSDNIPGIPGFGPKTAASLLKEFGSLDSLIKNCEKISNVKRREKILDFQNKAKLSQRLATIQLDVPFPKESHFFYLKRPDTTLLKDLYQEMNFASLAKELEVLVKPVEKEFLSYTLIESVDALEQMLGSMLIAKEICIDTETSAVRPMQAKLVGIGFCIEEKNAYYVPLNGSLDKELVLLKLKEFFKACKAKFFGHNIKYDLHILQNYGIENIAIGFDTILASYLLHPDINRHNLEVLSNDILGKSKTSIKDLIGTGKSQITMNEVPLEKAKDYCCEDVDYTMRLKHIFSTKLDEETLDKVFYEIEIPLLPILKKMERRGIFVDTVRLKELSKEYSEKLQTLEKYIYELADETFNIKSPKQLSTILFEKLKLDPRHKKKKTGYSTSAEVLHNIRDQHPIIEQIIAYRFYEKLRSTYIDALPSQINPHTHKVHCTFNQSVTATGRLSCQDPNLQNIPIRSNEGKIIRSAFKPANEHYSFLSADYSQIELRILAHLSGDKSLIKAFNENQDIHTYSASLIFNVALEEVSSAMRHQAKAVNFGIIYGQQAFGLAKETGMDIRQAHEFIQKYFARYPNVENFLNACKAHARRDGYALTLFGRKRPLPEINSSNGMLRSQAERFAVNAPIQGSQADIIKLAMIKIEQVLYEQNLRSYMILQIHDELIFECPNEELKAVKPLIIKAMSEVTSLKVPLSVDVKIGKNWGEC